MSDARWQESSKGRTFGRRVLFPETQPVEIEHVHVRSFLDYCLRKKPPEDFADRACFGPLDLRPWLGNLMVLDYMPEQDDFRYRLYGSRIAETSGFDMTGKLVSDFQSPMGVFFAELYHLSLGQRCLVFSRHSKLHSRFTVDWLRVICPLRSREGVQLVACNYPVQQDPDLPA